MASRPRRRTRRTDSLAFIPEELRSAAVQNSPPFIAESLRTPEASAELREFAKLWRVDPLETLKLAITCAAVAGVYAAMYARQKASARQESEQAIAALSDVVNGISEFEKMYSSHPGMTRCYFQQIGPDVEEDDLQLLMRHLMSSRQLITTFRENWGQPQPYPPRYDAFTQDFIRLLTLHWHAGTGNPPGRSRQGPFVTLASRAWRLLKLRAPVDDDELEDWLGYRAERSISDYMPIAAICIEKYLPGTR